MKKNIIKFIRQKDFIYLQDLGKGACGETILLKDDEIDEKFVCKKYSPCDERLRKELYEKFVQEIKLLHKIYHINVVRVFNYYLYPRQFAGYILMEYVNGTDISSYLKKYPENLPDIFFQTIRGFSYLESKKILHRDIRPANIMVTNQGIVKIIDFGFGKEILDSGDHDKSITLNWWCRPPEDFNQRKYSFSTEVYFVGKLFEKIISEIEFSKFQYESLLQEMCEYEGGKRVNSFLEIEERIDMIHHPAKVKFDEVQITNYRNFANCIGMCFSKIEKNATYYNEIEIIEAKINELYQDVMLEEHLPSCYKLTECFVEGNYYYKKNSFVSVDVLESFLRLLQSASMIQKQIILRNIHSRLDAIERYNLDYDIDIPF